MFSKLLKLAALSLMAGIIFWAMKSLAQTTSPALAASERATPLSTVSAGQLTSVGFKGAKLVTAQPGKFAPPVIYFRVKETLTGEPAIAWGDASNLVAITITKIADTGWRFNNGQEEKRDLTGRTQVNLGDNGYFISVTGPDQTKVAAIAHLLKTLH